MTPTTHLYCSEHNTAIAIEFVLLRASFKKAFRASYTADLTDNYLDGNAVHSKSGNSRMAGEHLCDSFACRTDSQSRVGETFRKNFSIRMSTTGYDILTSSLSGSVLSSFNQNFLQCVIVARSSTRSGCIFSIQVPEIHAYIIDIFDFDNLKSGDKAKNFCGLLV